MPRKKAVAPPATPVASVTNTHVTFALIAMVVAAGFAYFASTGTPAEYEYANAALVPAANSCQVTSVTLNGRCDQESVKGSWVTCQDGYRTRVGGGQECMLKSDVRVRADRICSTQTHCKKAGNGYGYNNTTCVKEITYGQACNGTPKYNNVQVTCGGNGRTYSTTQTQCMTASQHRNAAASYCRSQSCTPITSCTDPDVGSNSQFVSSTVRVVDQNGPHDFRDTCGDANTLNEMSCNTGNTAAVTTPINCGSGMMCHDGACVNNPAAGLQVSWDAASPRTLYPLPQSNYTTSKEVGRITINNTSNNSITVKKLNFNIASTFATTNARTVSIYKIVSNGSTRVGSQSFAAGVQVSDTTLTDSAFTDTTVPANGSVTFALNIDVTQLPTNGQVTISMGTDDIMWSNSTNSYDTAGGLPLAPKTLNATPRTTLSADWASDTPSGAGARGYEQTIGKIVMSSAQNAGSYASTVKSMQFTINQTTQAGSSFPFTAGAQLRVYKDSLFETPLATFTTSTNADYINVTWPDNQFTDVDISPGTSRTFFITADTHTAVSNSVFSIRMIDTQWSDGVIPLITGGVLNLPLTAKTLSY